MSDVERRVLFNTVFTERERPRIDEQNAYLLIFSHKGWISGTNHDQSTQKKISAYSSAIILPKESCYTEYSEHVNAL